MNPCLLILKPRSIPATERALDELPSWLPVIELFGYTERQLADGVFASVIDANRDFSHFMVASDDVIIRWSAIGAILRRAPEHEVLTGYCQATHTEWRTNLTRAPLQGDLPRADAYDFIPFQEIVSGPPTVRSWFTGMCLTFMPRMLWYEFPFQCFADKAEDPGYGSDFSLSKRLQEADIPITAVRDSFTYHWRNTQEHTNDPRDDRILVGQVEPGIRRR
jgi:hypothetical protein